VAKVYLFRTIYRGSGWAFSKDPDFAHVSSDPDYWDGLNLKFYKKYKGINECHTRWAQAVAERKPIISPLGREWMVTLNDDGSLPWTVFTNYPVQGSGADLVAIARVSLRRRLKERGMRSILFGTVHDDIWLDCPEEEVDDVAQMCYQVFKDIPMNVKRIWKVELPIPFPAEVYKGPNLKNLESVREQH
jgi:DNA polymerase-1